jgi:hypothetical protein
MVHVHRRGSEHGMAGNQMGELIVMHRPLR